jgi:hypothetical protein
LKLESIEDGSHSAQLHMTSKVKGGAVVSSEKILFGRLPWQVINNIRKSVFLKQR